MSRIYFRCVPYDKESLTLALESGVDGVIVPAEHAAQAAGLSRCQVWADEETPLVSLAAKADEEEALARMRAGERVVLASGWEVIPVENLLAQSDQVLAEAASLEQARLAAGILERGVAGIVVPIAAVSDIKAIVAQCKLSQGEEQLVPARVTRVEPVGLGHRVCADTLSLLRRLPHDRTTYLGELRAGQEVLIVSADGATGVATLGRVKIEVRPMLLIEAEVMGKDGPVKGAVFLQNAETIRLVTPKGEPVSVVALQAGDEVLCRVDDAAGGAGRHFGMRVAEEIREI